MWMMFGWWTEDMIWISLRIRMRSASVSILDFLIVLIATCRLKKFACICWPFYKKNSHLLAGFFIDAHLHLSVGALAKLPANLEPLRGQTIFFSRNWKIKQW